MDKILKTAIIFALSGAGMVCFTLVYFLFKNARD